MKAKQFLDTAKDEMTARETLYNAPGGERSMESTVKMFNELTGHTLTEEQGRHFMTLLKIVRSQQGDVNRDNYVDGAAYFALAGESATSYKGE